MMSAPTHLQAIKIADRQGQCYNFKECIFNDNNNDNKNIWYKFTFII